MLKSRLPELDPVAKRLSNLTGENFFKVRQDLIDQAILADREKNGNPFLGNLGVDINNFIWTTEEYIEALWSVFLEYVSGRPFNGYYRLRSLFVVTRNNPHGGHDICMYKTVYNRLEQESCLSQAKSLVEGIVGKGRWVSSNNSGYYMIETSKDRVLNA
jgi:hypothetical protein